MNEREELKKLQAMRAELEAESRLLIEKQEHLEKTVLALEKQVIAEELKKEQALIEDLRNRNNAVRDAISQLEAKKKNLENKLQQMTETMEVPSEKEQAAEESVAKFNETIEDSKPKAEPEDFGEGSVTITAIDGEGLVENQEIVSENPKKEEKKKHRFF